MPKVTPINPVTLSEKLVDTIDEVTNANHDIGKSGFLDSCSEAELMELHQRAACMAREAADLSVRTGAAIRNRLRLYK